VEPAERALFDEAGGVQFEDLLLADGGVEDDVHVDYAGLDASHL
jgi:hypothetical protein